MINKSLILLSLFSATLGYAKGAIGAGGSVFSKCQSANSQLVIESKASKENIKLHPLIVAQSDDGGISGSTGTTGNKSEIVVGISPAAFTRLESFIESNDELSILGKDGPIDIDAINIYAKLQLMELELENATVKLVGGGSGGNIPSSAKGGTSGGGSTIGYGGGGATPTITDIDDGAAGGGGTIGDVAGTIIGTGRGGTLSECGISGGSGVISGEIGGSGVGGDGWKKDGGSMGGSTADADGITVGGGTPYK
jgi:hypothetical protein